MKKKMGIWGLGIVGKSLLDYFSNKKYINLNYSIEVLDNRIFTQGEKEYFSTHNISYKNSDIIKSFLEDNTLIIPSPGIDLAPYKHYNHKFISELDMFFNYWRKKTIAVSGSVGKTSLVSILERVLTFYKYPVLKGGNIGIPLFSLLSQNNNTNNNKSTNNNNINDNYVALLELSSFQLEHSTKYAADIALWTNFYPNHLDRHGTLEDYFKAKYRLISNQNKSQKALINFSLYTKIKALKPKSQLYFFSTIKPNLNTLALDPNDTLYYFDNNNNIIRYITHDITHDTIHKSSQDRAYNRAYTSKIISNYALLPSLSYKENWLIIVALCDILGFDLAQLHTLKNISTAHNFSTHNSILEHRLEYIPTYNKLNNFFFYNDSKSTIMESTLLAVDHLITKFINNSSNNSSNKNNISNLYLFLGGLSKGVDRSFYIKSLTNKVKVVFCFGYEADMLYQLCRDNDLKTSSHKTLNEAFSACITIIKQGDYILFSPGGSSFDLFENYIDRGLYFKKLVKENQL